MRGRGATRRAALLGGLAAPWVARAAEPVVIAQSNDGLLYGPIHVALAKKYFEAEGIAPEVIVMGGGAKAMSAVLAGSAQVYAGAPFELVNAVERGQKVQAFAEVMNKVMISLIMRAETATRLGIKPGMSVAARIAAMRGLKLGISSPKSSGEALYRTLLRKGGIDPDRDVDIVPIGAGGQSLAAFLAGKVDMYTFSSPFAEQAVARGGGVVLFDLSQGEVADYASYPYISFIGREDWIDKSADTATRLVRGLARAMRLLQEDEAEARTVLRGVFGKLDPALFDAAFAANRHAYAATPRVEPASFATAIAEYALVNGRTVAIQPGQIATNRIAAAAGA